MSIFIKVKIDSKVLPQAFIAKFTDSNKKQYPKEFHVLSKNIVKNDVPSLVAVDEENQLVVKMVKPRSWHEVVKLLWGRSRLHKEVNGNNLLRSLDIKTANIKGIFVGLIPTRKYQYLGFYLMDDLHYQGYEDAFDCLRFKQLNKASRERLINNFYDDLQKMKGKRLLFADLKLNNVFSDSDGNIAWIDTGVCCYGSFSKARYKQKFNHSLDRFFRIYQSWLSESEIAKIQSLKLV